LRVTSAGAGAGAGAGLRAGDVILEANGYLTPDNESLRRITAASNGLLRLRVARQGVYEDMRSIIVDMRARAATRPGAAGAAR
jgi:hypothetical protein